MRKIFYIIGVLLLCISALTATPRMNDGKLGFRDWLIGGSSPASIGGLIDPSRLTVQHNVSFGLASGGGSSMMQSLYTTRFGYRVSDPLTLTLMLGVMNNQFKGCANVPASYSNFLGGVALDYRPRHDISIHFEVLRAPGLFHYSSPLQEMTSPPAAE